MACANPWYRPHKDLNGRVVHSIFDKIPCGWCTSCRVDHRNAWQDRIDWERLGNSSAFVTFTYDDWHLPFGDMNIPTLRRADFNAFIDRLRYRVKRVKLSLSRPDWKFYAVGEYGDKFNRPHYHCIFIGLDFYETRRLFHDVWQCGIIDSLPVLDGCTRYVLKYLDKQQHGSLAEEMFDNQGLERPFSTASTGLGNGLFYSQVSRIQKTGEYMNLAGKRRPCPQYYKDLFMGNSASHFEKQVAEYQRQTKDKTLKMFDDWQWQVAYARDKMMCDMNLASGHAVLRVDPATARPHSKGASVRQYMVEMYERSRFSEIESFNRKVMDILKKRDTSLGIS